MSYSSADQSSWININVAIFNAYSSQTLRLRLNRHIAWKFTRLRSADLMLGKNLVHRAEGLLSLGLRFYISYHTYFSYFGRQIGLTLTFNFSCELPISRDFYQKKIQGLYCRIVLMNWLRNGFGGKITMYLVWSTCSSSYCIQWQKQCNERKLGKGLFSLII